MTAATNDIQAPSAHPQTGEPAMLDAGRRGLAAALPAVLAAVALFSPLLVLLWNGLSPVGMTEESTGYRYFYSLRTLYTADERPWLPQGQVMTLGHLLLQWLLTTAGYPINQLTPRMELFAYLGAGLSHVGTAFAVFWALRPLTSVVARLAVVVALVWAVFDRALSYGYHLLVPDYHPWIHVVSLVALGCALRLSAEDARPSWRWIVGLGLFSGLALSLKVTLAVFVGPPVLLLLLRLRSVRGMVVAVLVIGALTVGLFLGITWLSYGGSVSATVRYFTLFFGFSTTADAPRELTPLGWYLVRLVADVSWPVRVSAATPILLLLSALLLRPRLLPLLLLPSSLLSLALMWKRDESTTLVEVFDCTLMVLVIWAVRVAAPALRCASAEGRLTVVWGRLAALRTSAAGVAAPVALVAFAGFVVVRAVPVLLAGFFDANTSQLVLDHFVTEPPGRVAIVTLGNDHRPLTRDSAIFKGGTNVGESNIWGVSPFVRALVPDRYYFFPAPGLRLPIDLSPFTYVLFVSRESPDRLAVTEAKLAELFGLSLIGFECPIQVPIPGGIQYGCKRHPDAPIADRQGEIGFVSGPVVLRPDAAVAWGSEPRRPLRVGEAAYSAASGEVWRLDGDGSYTRLRGEQGQTVRIAALGAWTKGDGETTGLPAVFDGMRWTVAELPSRPVNRNPTLRIQQDRTVRGWDVFSRDQVTVDRRSGPTSPAAPEGWLELQSRSPEARVGVRAGLDRDDFAGGPVMAVVSARAFGRGAIWVRIGSAAAGNSVSVARSVGDDSRRVASSGEWETLVVRLEPDQLVGDRAAVIVELADSRAGDRLDIGRVEVFAGRYP